MASPLIWRIATGFFLAISVVQTVRVVQAQSAAEASAELRAKLGKACIAAFMATRDVPANYPADVCP